MYVDNNSYQSSSKTTSASSPPLDSPNTFFQMNENDLRFLNQPQGFPTMFQSSAAGPSNQHMGPPIYPMHNFNQINHFNLNFPHQRSTSFPTAASGSAPPHQGSQQNFAPGTIDPQLISPPLESTAWNQPAFLQPSHLGSQALAQTQSIRNANVHPYANLYTTLEAPFDRTQHTQSNQPLPVFKTESKAASLDLSAGDQSNETSLHPESTSSLVSGARGSRSTRLSDGSAAVQDSKPSRQSRRAPPRPPKRKKLSEEDSEEEEDSDEDRARGAAKFHKACANCRKQKGKCVKRESDDKCRMCRTRNLPCVFEARPERKQPVQRSVLMEQLKRKDAIIESFRQMLKPHMLQHLHSGSENNPSSGSPPSSAAHEEPLRKQVIEWLEKAEASRASTGASFNLDSRAFQDSSSDDDKEEPIDKFSSNASSHSRPPLHHHNSYGWSISSTEQNQVDLTRRSRSPRVTRNAAIHPFDLLARASLRGSGVGSHTSSVGEPLTSPTSPANIGVARPDYFVSSDSMDKRASRLGLRKIELDRGLSEEPKLLRKGLIVPEEVDKLFGIFYEKLNPSVSILDPVLHTPESTFARCPLLFTVVCAVASRYYTERPELYSIAMHFAMTSASTSLMESKKSVELCQAYLLLSVWSLPSRKYDEDRAWLYLGLAIRMAMDLNLHMPTNVEVESEQHKREVLNRTRTWIICFNMDRSSSAQLGKPMTIRENYMIRSSQDWYTRSEYNHPYDIHLCQLTALMRIMSRFQETVYADANSASGVKEDLDLRRTAFEFDDEIVQWEKETTALFAAQSKSDDPGCFYRCHLLPFYVNYSRLVILSFGFQYSFNLGLLSPNDDLVIRCIRSAHGVIHNMINDPVVQPYLRYAPDGHLVFVSFASAFLLKLLRPKFVHLLTPENRFSIIPLVERLVRVLNDPSVAIDDSHTPRIYARFLAGLLHKHRTQITAQQTEQTMDTQMHMQNTTNGLKIDLNMIHQVANPLSPSSPHPFIQVTPPPTDLTFGFLLHDPNVVEDDERDSMGGNEFDIPLGSSAAPSGSGTVHPMDEIARQEEDEDTIAPLKAIQDPAFWGHAMIPWPEVSIPSGHWDKDISNHPFLNSLDGF